MEFNNDIKYYNVDKEDVTKDLSVNPDRGLSESEVKTRREKYGLNEFTPKEEGSFWDDLKDSLSEPMIVILIIAAVVSAVIGETHDAIGIVGAIAIGIAIGMITEGRSKKAADALSKMTENIEVKVLRDGEIHQISKNELVPGDIVYIETGDMVPADGRLIETINLKIREDMLTGESDDVSKKCDVVVPMEEIESKGALVVQEPIPAKQINMVFGGTLVAYGRGILVVTSIGDSSEMGKIAQNLSDADEQTPLQIKLGNLGGLIAKVSSAVAGLLFIFMVFQMVSKNVLNVDMSGILPFLESIDPVKTAFTVCVALIVAAVPEGLPTMINMTLAITMQKMAKINALVTKKEACETIGSVSVICSDKTGTLTENRMTVEVAYIDGRYIESSEEEINSYFEENCMINSTADVEHNDNDVKYLGSATECALLLYYKNVDYRQVRKESNIVAQNPFTSDSKRMTSVIGQDNNHVLLSKGAPEVLLELCSHIQRGKDIVPITEGIKHEILEEIKKLQVKSMRTLGFAYKEISQAEEEAAVTAESDSMNVSAMESNLVFSGFVGIRDPLRKDVIESVNTANKAGVSVKMLTGDNINTARAIGEELGLLKGNMRAVEASYIDTLDDEELKQEIQTISIVARSKPDSKMRIVSALQKSGDVVAVTGDGINDAPALSKADVGIAMGISGTEVSKSAADIILTDDSFSTIVKGIKWGRGIYDNFQRFVQFQLTVNVIAFLVAIISQVMGQEMPFTTIQLLWVNIIMDGPPALALGLEPVRDHVLNRKPVDRKANIISKSMVYTIVLNAFYITAILMLQSTFNFLGVDEAHKGTVMFALFAFSALFNAFNCREFSADSIFPNFTHNKLALQIIVLTGIAQVIFTQLFQDFFNSVAMDVMTWVKVLCVAASVVVVNEVVKCVIRLVKPKKTA
ncbi:MULTISPECIES: calcium-translocating P-type ATPase, PMCA-type [unclassified Clostridioides]|uniref:calcium-translocating P-type ATPase, PMCA-type n=1 Tax=unclassified Clostridioides TaxID=2635829 RepID=UPI001D12E498|nr:calcium-translocating P-type ATPase, PMCA-type [Clostridioides sp. ES-S-0001-02]MCC0640067.1 calcium-translocating P-type ATPase, PMCA-type [Clostridioides sp. ES-S-0049-03]MCC0655505.1 calcium-translocating P-type ATPase, PMCA-type [Clostridioides sp. ES-S-0123-01]MCC0674711.1 calcium-translocating P-type ATPase, PMCA-type [Clostridioides sp. ES-W-0018-02]MCC0679240.1 calcium-translocating P-type ATPase, PMCA-type [Clostridioides sp. ES-S-0005-03]MCC0702600.1 calcium-translocating P-type A